MHPRPPSSRHAPAQRSPRLCGRKRTGPPRRAVPRPPAPGLQHDLLNVFLGGMLGGSVVYGLREVINDPSEPRLLLLLLLFPTARQ